MVQSVAHGQALADRADLTPAQRRLVLVRAGEVLARLNRIDVPGFWRPGPDGVWPHRVWATLMTGWVDDREAEHDLVCGTGFDSAQFSRMIVLLRAHVRDFPCRQPVLCHPFRLNVTFKRSSPVNVTLRRNDGPARLA